MCRVMERRHSGSVFLIKSAEKVRAPEHPNVIFGIMLKCRNYSEIVTVVIITCESLCSCGLKYHNVVECAKLLYPLQLLHSGRTSGRGNPVQQTRARPQTASFLPRLRRRGVEKPPENVLPNCPWGSRCNHSQLPVSSRLFSPLITASLLYLPPLWKSGLSPLIPPSLFL